ncbi:hypothetical protein CVV68_21030 [Arthrobacter livingstonensis]|uniref:TIGR00374 family protein n=1 Tax=Arthrobacter livingstonensis TaxID=670078 RepID=A0A2V5L0S6_9MICC|nr:YbhN family protein [Arthrobacter livingstonensis]PYI64749.1 hypothetical protein CVV68_21030 [Arthrobacter livingstonensis]
MDATHSDDDGHLRPAMSAGVVAGTATNPVVVHRHIPKWLLAVASALVLIVLVPWIIVPQYSNAVQTLGTLERISLPLVLLAGILELSSLLAYSALTASVLGPGRPSYFTLLRIDLADLGVNHVVPGGGATAAAVRFSLLQRAGTRPAEALTAATIEIAGSNLVLAATFAVGLLLSLTTVAANGYYRTASIAGFLGLLGTGLGIWFLTRYTDSAIGIARATVRHLPLVSENSAEAFLRMMANQILLLGRSPRRIGVDFLLGAANWLLDAAALWVLLAAFGHYIGIGPLLTVYGVGSILAMLPLTPGGLGIVEGVMVPALIGFGTPAGVALLGVIGWRLIEFWLPIPLGALAYASLRLGTFRQLR